MLPFRNLEVKLQPDAVSTLGVSKHSAASSGRVAKFTPWPDCAMKNCKSYS